MRARTVLPRRCPPGPTLWAPDGVIIPLAPAEAVMVKPTEQAPVATTQKGAAPLLLAHWASVEHALHALEAWLQMGADPLHWLSVRQPTQAPDTSQ